MDKHLKKFFRVTTEEEEKKWDALIEEISKAEEIKIPEKGSEAFFKILKGSLGKKRRRFAIRKFREYRERGKNPE